MSFPSISLKFINNNATAQSFERGDRYYRSGSVEQITQRGNVLRALVNGNEPGAYQVTMPFDAAGITSAHCSCPYSFEGWCKHVVATLLVCNHQPELIEIRPSLDELLDRLDLNQTRQIICKLLADRPELVETLDSEINSLVTIATTYSSKPKKVRSISIDPKIYRHQISDILQNALRGWEEGYEDDSIVADIGKMVGKAAAFSVVGAGESAIGILEGITQGCIDSWDEIDQYSGYSEPVVELLDRAWAEAILTTDMTAELETELRSKLQHWQQEWDEEFPVCMTALGQGWSYPPLVQVLKGEMTAFGAWESTPPSFADRVALVRLEILHRQERSQEYLYLAKADGKFLQYWMMLVNVGRMEEAVDSAKVQMTNAEDVYTLAKLLRTEGAIEQALEIAHLGLRFPVDRRSDFTQWTSDLAEGSNKPQFALDARVAGFHAGPSFADYLKIQELAGDGWPLLRQELFKTLDQVSSDHFHRQALVDIFLHEGLFDRAIDMVKKLTAYYDKLIQQVMDGVLLHSPDWVIETSRSYAEDIIDRKRSDIYDQAIQWLKRTKAAYEANDRRTEWREYHQNLIHVHSRKRKLIDLLKRL